MGMCGLGVKGLRNDREERGVVRRDMGEMREIIKMIERGKSEDKGWSLCRIGRKWG